MGLCLCLQRVFIAARCQELGREVVHDVACYKVMVLVLMEGKSSCHVMAAERGLVASTHVTCQVCHCY